MFDFPKKKVFESLLLRMYFVVIHRTAATFNRSKETKFIECSIHQSQHLCLSKQLVLCLNACIHVPSSIIDILNVMVSRVGLFLECYTS